MNYLLAVKSEPIELVMGISRWQKRQGRAWDRRAHFTAAAESL